MDVNLGEKLEFIVIHKETNESYNIKHSYSI